MDVHWQNSHAQQEGKNLKYSYITSQEHNMLKPTFDFVFHQKSFVCNNGRLSSSQHFSQLEILDFITFDEFIWNAWDVWPKF